MSAFEGLRLIRKQSASNPHLSFDEIIQVIAILEPVSLSLDIEASLYLHSLVDKTAPYMGTEFYRHCISSLIVEAFPAWAKLITLGRNRFMQKLYGEEFRDVRSLFRQAGLLSDPPTKFDIEWWDFVSGRVRLEGDRQKLERGRMAEELSLEYERKRLKSEGIVKEPKWMAIEDNTAGYDILSYNKGTYDLINKLIEVKSTVASPLRFYVTRNEWNQAVAVGDAYLFHIWNLAVNPPVLYIKMASDIAPHIPQDNKKGKWALAEIPITNK